MTVLAPDVVKVGVEGYEHGWVCVRPPCGTAPGHVRASDLGVKRDGTVVHRPSGYAIGHVKKTESGHGYIASHVLDGRTTTRSNRADAVASVARKHNKAVKSQPVTEADVAPPKMPAPHVRTTEENSQNATIGHVTALNEIAHTYTDAQIQAISDRINKLQEEAEADAKKDSRFDIAVDTGILIAAVTLSFFTAGASLLALVPMLTNVIPALAGIFTKSAMHIRKHGAPKLVATTVSNARDKLGNVPVMSAAHRMASVAKAGSSISPAAVAQVAQVIAKQLAASGLDPDVASSMALAMTSHAAVALRAGKFPGDNDFITADGSPSEDSSIEKSAETAVLSTVHHPLGIHGLWHDKHAMLPAYIQNVAHSLIRSGHDESSAIAIAIGAVKRWAVGRGKVTPEVRAAAVKALAEWEKLKAEHSKSKT